MHLISDNAQATILQHCAFIDWIVLAIPIRIRTEGLDFSHRETLVGEFNAPLRVTYRACARARGMRATCEPAAGSIAASAPQIAAALKEPIGLGAGSLDNSLTNKAIYRAGAQSRRSVSVVIATQQQQKRSDSSYFQLNPSL